MSLNLLGKETERGIPGTRKSTCKGLVACKCLAGLGKERTLNPPILRQPCPSHQPSSGHASVPFLGIQRPPTANTYLPCLPTWHTVLVSLPSPWNLLLSLLQGTLLLCSTCNRQHSRGLLHFTHIAWVISAISLASVIISIQVTPRCMSLIQSPFLVVRLLYPFTNCIGLPELPLKNIPQIR